MDLGAGNPVGANIALPKSGCPKCDIKRVGLSANSLYGNLKGDAEPTVYLPVAQGIWPQRSMTYELRTTGNPLGDIRAVRDIVRRVDDRLQLADVRTQNAWIEETIRGGVLAELCGAGPDDCCMGLYGSMSYNVGRRNREIGIRMALGAQRGRVVWIVLGEVVVLATVALAIALPVAFTDRSYTGGKRTIRLLWRLRWEHWPGRWFWRDTCLPAVHRESIPWLRSGTNTVERAEARVNRRLRNDRAGLCCRLFHEFLEIRD